VESHTPESGPAGSAGLGFAAGEAALALAGGAALGAGEGGGDGLLFVERRRAAWFGSRG
jgi:hypothetical protein